GATDCGDGRFCEAGLQCATKNFCMPVGATDCGGYHCDALRDNC
ncbi:6009_t:CDS:2, partial [Funneliformis mosseae]